MGRTQTAFNIIACVGAAFHILCGVLAVYFLAPSNMNEPVLSRHARNAEKSSSSSSVNITTTATSARTSAEELMTACNQALTCDECLNFARRCFWFETTTGYYCYDIESESPGIKSQLTGFYDRIHADGVRNVQWGSCSAPLTVTVFMIMSMVLVAVIFIAFCMVHFVCNNNKETEMLIEADLAAQNEQYLTRLGRLNPLPFNKGASSKSFAPKANA